MKLTFMAIGDFGWSSPVRDKVISTIQHQESQGLDAVIALGDNFYDYGVSSVRDSRWDEWESSFHPRSPWYAVLGNHDYLGDPLAQVKRSMLDKRWNMLARYFDKVFYFKDGLKTQAVHFFFLDTFRLCPNISRKLSIAMGMNPLHFEAKYASPDLEQLHWLDKKLSKSKATWRVVVGHYPIFSNGHHGPTSEMMEYVLPILRHHEVDFYLSGHDHNMECIAYDDIQFIISGAGCSSNSVDRSTYPSLFKSNAGDKGVFFMDFHPTTATFGFKRDNSVIFHRHILPRHSHTRYFYKS